MSLDEEDLRALRRAFLGDAPSRISRLEKGLRNLERGAAPGGETALLAGLAHEAHTLKGSAATVGFGDLNQPALELQEALEAEDVARARRALDALVAGLDAVERPPPTVLCIEDDPASLLLVERIAARAPGVQVLTATQGLDGLALARREHPDLVLLDLLLPDLPGEEVLRRLREEPLTRSIPVVVLSADAMPGRAAALLEAGANEYLTKPLDLDRVLELIRNPPASGP